MKGVILVIFLAIGLLLSLIYSDAAPPPAPPAGEAVDPDKLSVGVFCTCHGPKGPADASKATFLQNGICCKEQFEKGMGEKIILMNGTDADKVLNRMCMFHIVPDKTPTESLPTFKTCCKSKPGIKGLCLATMKGLEGSAATKPGA